MKSTSDCRIKHEGKQFFRSQSCHHSIPSAGGLCQLQPPLDVVPRVSVISCSDGVLSKDTCVDTVVFPLQPRPRKQQPPPSPRAETTAGHQAPVSVSVVGNSQLIVERKGYAQSARFHTVGIAAQLPIPSHVGTQVTAQRSCAGTNLSAVRGQSMPSLRPKHTQHRRCADFDQI